MEGWEGKFPFLDCLCEHWWHKCLLFDGLCKQIMWPWEKNIFFIKDQGKNVQKRKFWWHYISRSHDRGKIFKFSPKTQEKKLPKKEIFDGFCKQVRWPWEKKLFWCQKIRKILKKFQKLFKKFPRLQKAPKIKNGAKIAIKNTKIAK